MIPQLRQELLLKIARENGFVSIPKTAQQLGISVETLRRDINGLCQKELLRKVHGGAVPSKAPLVKSGRQAVIVPQSQHSKIAIAKAAAALIRDGSVISLDGSDITLAMVPFITEGIDVTYVVNSLSLGIALQDRINARELQGNVVMTGGNIAHGNYRALNSMALHTLEMFYYDLVFLTCVAISADCVSHTATNPSVYAQRMMRRSSASILLVDSNRLGKESVRDFAKPGDFDRIITDNQNPVPADLQKVLNDAGTALTIVSCKP